MIEFGSVCSGIEAASVAWHPLGWRASWLAEIEPFPSAVLAHHYPSTPNHGDMTLLPDLIGEGIVDAPPLFCGGTPCQAFSVAGLRKSLDDARGNLSLTFCEIANAIDTQRADHGKQPAIIFWENVPGVLSTKDNAFGCFLAGLAGEDRPLEPAGGKWTNAGVVLGPQRAVAWRVLDAQYFGVAQRRRRVFVVASARDDFDPVEVLFEFDGLRRDTAPSREAGQKPAEGAANGTGVRGYRMTAFGEYANDDTASCMKLRDYKDATDIVTHSLRGEGFDASEDGTGRGTPLVPCVSSGRGWWSESDGVAQTLRAQDSINKADTLVPVAFSCKDHGADAGDLAPTLRAMGHGASHANAGGQVAVAFHPTQDPISSTDGLTCSQQAAVCHPINTMVGLRHKALGRSTGLGIGADGDAAYTLSKAHSHAVGHGMQVRRLTPVECERLQGFPDDYTLIPYRNKPAADGPRYKALGNSWAVPNVRWIGRRIHAHLFGGIVE